MLNPTHGVLQKTTGNIVGTNFPKDAEGHTYHLAMKAGELANDIIIVGDPNRATIVAGHLSPDPTLPHVFPHTCNRGFTAFTGFFEGHRVSVVSIGMGFPMVDFFVREARAIVDGPMKIIRLGSCGTPQKDISVGTVVVSKYAVGIFDDHRPFTEIAHTERKYEITNQINPDSKLHNALIKTLSVASREFPVVEAGNASAEYFYSTQGRLDSQFPDGNEKLLDNLVERYPDVSAIEMESYVLFNLAASNTAVAEPGKGISAAACNIVLAARATGVFLSNERKHEIELSAGRACLNALILS